jgi:hypothetical protein
MEIDYNFNFHDGSKYDVSDQATSDPKRMPVAQAINNALPFDIQDDIQDDFQPGAITYYDPGNSAFYHTTAYTKGGSGIIHVARSCSCYESAIDKETHFLAYDEKMDSFQPSKFNSETILLATSRNVSLLTSVWGQSPNTTVFQRTYQGL